MYIPRKLKIDRTIEHAKINNKSYPLRTDWRADPNYTKALLKVIFFAKNYAIYRSV